MPSSITGAAPTEYGLLGQLLANSAAVRQNLTTLTEQASSGLIAQSYAGLGRGTSISLDLRPHITALQTQQSNIAAATTRLGVTQAAMTQLQQIAATFLSKLSILTDLNPSAIDTVAADAQAALGQTASLLDTRDGNVYVFAGQDTANPPVPNPDGITSSGFYTQIATAVANLGVTGAAATVASTLAVGASNAAGTSVFSAYLSQPASALQAPMVQVGQNHIQQVGLFASGNASVASAGSSTTGSYMRDLMRSLATLGSLRGGQANDPNFAGLIQDTRASLTGAISAMAADVGVLGDTQAALTATQTNLSDTQTSLTAQVDAAENVDMATILSNLTQAQTQLQTSYRLIAGLSTLSLAKYLSGG